MRNRRTDLALESHQLWQQQAGQTTQLPGVKAEDRTREGFPVTAVQVLDREGARALDKEIGTYLTLTLDGLERREEDSFFRAVRAVAAELSTLLPPPVENSPVLVVGLGNPAITPDALGPLVHRHTLVTRHLIAQMPDTFAGFGCVAGIAAGVLGTTGLESGEVVSSLCRTLHPSCVVAVDALAARCVHRLCRTVQLCDAGISPGSGVGNHRTPLNQETLGVPVIAIGVPTVVDAATLAADLLNTDQTPDLDDRGGLFVTPRDIDSQVRLLSRVIGYGIDLALHPGLSPEELELLLD